MSKERRATRQMIAHRAAAQLHAGETKTDDALHQLGLLCAELPRMRQEAQLSAVVGQDLFDGMARAYAAMAEARKHLVQVHDSFERVRLQLNLTPVTGAGGTDKPPSNEVRSGLAAA